ncbi:MAG: LLM class flavin-dependent oxidoreductase [Deltaproteobacteria bacterium]|nr:LLM class flavin-dependent oxidoreductase [Deltaproteobacteria bacterium]
MEYGVQLANLDFSQLRDRAQAAEGQGYTVVTVPDHIVMEGPEKSFDPKNLSYDPMIMIAVIAEATKKARVGHLVLCNLFRHPAITAQSLASLDQLSGGRIVAGLGTGWTEREFRMTGMPYPDITTRIRMLDEALTCMRSLWSKEETDFAGEFYRLDGCILFPKTVQQPTPPILLGGGGRGLLRVAAKHADVVNIIADAGKPGYIKLENVAKLTDDAFTSKVKFLRDEAARHGRDGKKIRISNMIFTTILTDSPAATRATVEGMAPMFNLTPEGMMRSPMALVGTPEECVAELKRRVRDWDVSQVLFGGSIDSRTQQRLAEEVLKHV